MVSLSSILVGKNMVPMLKPLRYFCCYVSGIAALMCAAVPAVAQESSVITFDIARFDVSGNSFVPVAEVEKVLQPYTGKARSFNDVQEAQEHLEALFRQRGFALISVNLPEQELNQGVVKLVVIQPKIGKVNIKGNQHFSAQNIRASFPALHEGQSPNIDEVSASLRLVNENPAKKASFSLQAGEHIDEVDAHINVSDQKLWKLGVNMDNSGTEETGETHLGINAQYANLFDRDHVLGLFYLTTVERPSSISVYGLNYHIPLYSLGDSVDLYGSYSDIDSGSVSTGLLDLQIAGKGTVLGVHYNQQLKRIKQYESKLVYGFDYKAYDNTMLLIGYDLGNDVTVHPLSLSYQGAWTLDNGRAGIELTAIHNIPSGSAEDIELARSGGKDDYSILRYSADYTRSLKADWLLRVKFSGQSSPDALIPGEQFGVGGGNSVRGFMEREVANDSGFLTNLEIYSPSLCSSFKSMNGHCRVLAFYDNGHVSRNKALPDELNRESISSAGLGLRVDIAQSLNLQMDYGVVVEAGGSQREGDKRLHVAMNWAY